MDPENEAIEMLSEQAERLLEQLAAPETLKPLLEHPGGFHRSLWNQAAELGWPAAAITEDQGGFGLGLGTLNMLCEKLGARAASLPIIPAAVVSDVLSRSDVESGIGADLAAGARIACIALGEPGEAGVPSAPSVTFSDGKLFGTKATAPFAAIADFALCHATVDGGVALLLVDLNQPGVNRHVIDTIDNARAAAGLSFDGAPALRIDSGDGWTTTMRAASLAAIATAFEQVGGVRRCLDLAIAYAKERVVFGQPIGRLQAIKHKLSDIYSELEIARGCAIDAAAAAERGSAALVPMAAMARMGGTRAYEFASRETIQVFGGIGVTWEAEPQHHYRRSRALALELGSMTFWRDLLVDDVLLLAEA